MVLNESFGDLGWAREWTALKPEAEFDDSPILDIHCPNYCIISPKYDLQNHKIEELAQK